MVKIVRTPVLVTLNVIYFRPDYRNLVQSFTWQTPDIVPELVRVHKFLKFWKENIEAIIESVEVSVPDKNGRPNWRNVDYWRQV